MKQSVPYQVCVFLSFIIKYMASKNDVLFVIPSGVTTICDCAFVDSVMLKSVVIPDSVTSIGAYAFEYCSSLTSIVIPKSVTHMGSSVFYGCVMITVYCEAESQPDTWERDWNPTYLRPVNVVWGYKGENN